MAGQSIAAASSQAWAGMGAQAETALNSGWILDQTISSTGGFNTAAAPSTLTAFLSSGDGTTGSGNGYWAVGRLARVVHTGGTAYAAVQASSYTAPVTTVTLFDWQPGGTTSVSTLGVTSAAVSPSMEGPSGTNNEYTKVRLLYRTTTTVVASTAAITSDSTMFSYTVPGGIMGTSGILRLRMYGDHLANGVSIGPVCRLIIGTSTVIAGSSVADNNVQTSANRRYWNAEFLIANVASASAQRVGGYHAISGQVTSFHFSTANPAIIAIGYGTAAEASSVNMTISYQIRLNSTAVGSDLQLRLATLELIQ